MDQELRLQLLRACVRDSTFLRNAEHDLTAEDFAQPEERIVAKAALEFYEKYQEPIGAMLRSEAAELAQQGKLGAERRDKLSKLLDTIQGGKLELVAVKALIDKVKRLKKVRFYQEAVEQIVQAYEKNELQASLLSELVDKANRELTTNGHVASTYFEELDKRILRRARAKGRKYPLLMIDPLDVRMEAIGRGHVGMVLAPPASGKGMFLVHISTHYAMQGMSVLHFTLEDPLDEVENRLDASLTGIPMKRLVELPKTLRKKFRAVQQEMRGRLRIIDGTEGGWTVSAIEKRWYYEHQHGFTADAIVIDYDDELVCEKQYKGESARRMEFAEIYRKVRQMAAKLNVMVWIAAQTGKKAEKKKVIEGRDTAEDYSKIRKVFLAIGLGRGENKDEKYLNVIRHKTDRDHFGVYIKSNYAAGMFYDREATLEMIREKKEAAARKRVREL